MTNKKNIWCHYCGATDQPYVQLLIGEGKTGDTIPDCLDSLIKDLKDYPTCWECLGETLSLIKPD